MPLQPPAPTSKMLAPGSFDDTRVLIVTQGHWLSKEIASAFAHYGATVIVAAAERHVADNVLTKLDDTDKRHIAIAINTEDTESIKSVFDKIEQRCGAISVLINPTDEGIEYPAEQLPPSQWRTITSNLLDASFFCAQEFARRRIDDESGGVIINFATPYVATGGAGLAPWETSRAALAHLTKSLAVEWAPYNIRVNAVAPGFLTSPDDSLENGVGGAISDTLAGGRCAESDDVTACVLYMCTPYAAYLTGHIFDVDGASWQRQGRLPPRYETIRSRYERNHGLLDSD